MASKSSSLPSSPIQHPEFVNQPLLLKKLHLLMNLTGNFIQNPTIRNPLPHSDILISENIDDSSSADGNLSLNTSFEEGNQPATVAVNPDSVAPVVQALNTNLDHPKSSVTKVFNSGHLTQVNKGAALTSQPDPGALLGPGVSAKTSSVELPGVEPSLLPVKSYVAATNSGGVSIREGKFGIIDRNGLFPAIIFPKPECIQAAEPFRLSVVGLAEEAVAAVPYVPDSALVEPVEGLSSVAVSVSDPCNDSNFQSASGLFAADPYGLDVAENLPTFSALPFSAGNSLASILRSVGPGVGCSQPVEGDCDSAVLNSASFGSGSDYDPDHSIGVSSFNEDCVACAGEDVALALQLVYSLGSKEVEDGEAHDKGKSGKKAKKENNIKETAASDLQGEVMQSNNRWRSDAIKQQMEIA